MDTFSKHLNAAQKMLSKRGQRYKSAGGFQKRQHSFILTEARDLGVCCYTTFKTCTVVPVGLSALMREPSRL